STPSGDRYFFEVIFLKGALVWQAIRDFGALPTRYGPAPPRMRNTTLRIASATDSSLTSISTPGAFAESTPTPTPAGSSRGQRSTSASVGRSFCQSAFVGAFFPRAMGTG